MNNSLFIALIAGLGAMVGWGTADFFAKKTIDRLGDVQTLFWQQLVGIIPLSLIYLAHPSHLILHHTDFLFIAILGAVSGLSYLPLYTGFGKGQLSLLSPIFAAYSVVVVILSVVFLHEPLRSWQVLAIGVTTLGILLVSTNVRELRGSAKRHAFKLAGMPEVVSAMLVYSVWLIFLDKFLQDRNWVPAMLLIRIVSTLTLLVYSLARKIRLSVGDRKLWKYIICIGVFDVVAYSFVSYGFSHTRYAGIIAVLSATFSVPTIILARLFLREHIDRLQLAAIAIIICGIVLISIV